MFDGIGRWWRARRTGIGLYALDDRLLADMGVCRKHLAWHLRSGRTCRPDECAAAPSTAVRREPVPGGRTCPSPQTAVCNAGRHPEPSPG